MVAAADFSIFRDYQALTGAGLVIGGPEYEKSLASSLIDSEMAGPISMKFSEID